MSLLATSLFTRMEDASSAKPHTFGRTVAPCRGKRRRAMNLGALESWLLLLQMETVMRLRDFKALHDLVTAQEVCSKNFDETLTGERLCRSMDYACVFYFKRVLCLQRSAATTLLLRRHGWDAQLVIGVQMVPFRSHAWVELQGSVVNDKPYMPDIFQVLERC
jgi:hypothetical protein